MLPCSCGTSWKWLAAYWRTNSCKSYRPISVRRSNGKTEFYEWGGTSCPAAKLNESEVGMLERAFHNRARTLVTPRFKSGEGTGVRCLVGFELSAG